MSLLLGFISRNIIPLATTSKLTINNQARHFATTSLFGRFNNTIAGAYYDGIGNRSSNYLLTTLRFTNGGKTSKSVAKRIRIRGSGSLKRMKSGRSHNTGYKTRQRVNRLGCSTGVEGKKIEKNVRKLLGAL